MKMFSVVCGLQWFHRIVYRAHDKSPFRPRTLDLLQKIQTAGVSRLEAVCLQSAHPGLGARNTFLKPARSDEERAKGMLFGGSWHKMEQVPSKPNNAHLTLLEQGLVSLVMSCRVIQPNFFWGESMVFSMRSAE